MKYNLKKKLTSSFIKMLLLPIVLLSLFIVVILISLRSYMVSQIEVVEIQKAEQILKIGIQREKHFLEDENTFHQGKNLLERLDELLNKEKPYNAQMLVIDKGYNLQASSKNYSQYEEKILHPYIVNMIQKKVHISDIETKERAYIVLQTPLECLDSYLIVVVKKSDILTTVKIIQKISRSMVFSILFIFFIILYFIYRFSSKKFTKLSSHIIDPIVQLSVISSNIDRYQKNLPRFKTHIVEVDELGKNFVLMVQALNQKTKELHELNLTLEERIQKATRKIRDKNRMTEKLLSTVMEAVIIWDEEYNLVDVNDITFEIFGYEMKDEIVGKNIFEFIPQEEQAKAKASLQIQSITPYEITLYKKGNIPFPALVKGSNTYINNILHRIVTVIDLSDVKEKDKLLLLQSKQAQMGEMISMIAHQWRQPLNAISASSINLSLLSSMGTLQESKLQESSVFIQNQCQKMSLTIDTFMNFVKPSKGSKKFHIMKTVDNIMQIIQGQLENHNISVIRSEEDIVIEGYEDLLEQVILNILTNARDAFSENSRDKKQIKITILNKEGIATIFIEDNAGGIAPEIQEKIFNPYFTTKEQGKGTGIGLYMSLDIMKKSFKGDLLYHSKENGSCFEIVCAEGKRE